MPQLLKIGPYIIYFWFNESEPLEPVHVHIAEGIARKDAAKVRITSTGKTLLCNNKKNPERILNKLLRVVEANSAEFMDARQNHFGEISFYC